MRGRILRTGQALTYLALLCLFRPTAAEAYDFKVLSSSACCIAEGPLLVTPSGNLFGTTWNGPSPGEWTGGTVFTLAKNKRGKWEYKSIHAFCPNPQRPCSKGQNPVSNLIIDSAGALYGVTKGGGRGGDKDNRAGTIFKLTPDAGKWKWSLVHEFCTTPACPDGAFPDGGLTYLGAAAGQPYDGASPLYGTARSGGSGSGVVFQLTPQSGTGDWTYTIIYSFCPQGSDGCLDGIGPVGPLLMDNAGSLFGETDFGGANKSFGAVFELKWNARTSKWQETILHSFHGGDGDRPRGGLVMDKAGNLYGTTYGGGFWTYSNVFKVIPKGENSPFTVLYSFCAETDCTDGAVPDAGVLIDSFGNVLGTTLYGGGNDYDIQRVGGGTVFRIESGSHTSIHNFCSDGQWQCLDGYYPEGLVMGQGGTIYGVTQGSGSASGVIFQLTP